MRWGERRGAFVSRVACRSESQVRIMYPPIHDDHALGTGGTAGAGALGPARQKTGVRSVEGGQVSGRHSRVGRPCAIVPRVPIGVR